MLSEETRLDLLLHKVATVCMKYATATRGFLIVERDNRLVIEVALDVEFEAMVPAGTALTGCPELATTVVEYVDRTAEQLVLADATSDRRFSVDPYLQSSGPSAILCTPLVHKGRRHGIIYLENHLVTGCFTATRLKTVQVLAAQAAVSIENAALVDNLELRVAERTQALEQALEQTRVQHRQLVRSQQALVMSDRLAVLGQLVAGVAHELNTPLGSIGATSDNLAASVDGTIGLFSEVVKSSTAEERASLTSLVLAARAPLLSSRDRRAARRALAEDLARHHVDDSAGAADVLVDMGITALAPDQLAVLASPSHKALLGAAAGIASLRSGVGNIQESARRMSRIVFALKNYANPGGRDTFVESSLSANLDTVLALYGHQLKAGFEVVRDFADDTVIEAMHDRLNQVWTNLVHNALQAMETHGTLTLRIQPSGADHMTVSVGDTGPGVPHDVRDHIFESFFTTKPSGEGAGLGLSICKDIVDVHGGTITLDSVPGCTTFSVKLPVKARAAATS